MGIRYPTKDEILAYLPPADPAEAKAVRAFLEVWDRTLPSLIAFGGEFCGVTVRAGATDRFLHASRVIELATPSMLILLHERGHQFYGRSEICADRYAVALLKAACPEAMANATWKGRTIVGM